MKRSFFSSMWISSQAAAAAFAALVICLAHPASASTFTVNPTQVVLTSRATSALLMLKNESDQVLRFQLTVFAWDQGEDGVMRLQPTQDIVFFPALVSLEPRDQRYVRIGAATAFGTVEKTYRIFIEELPSQDSGPTEASIRVLTKMGVPIFLKPARVQAQGSVRDLALHDGVFSFAVSNTGNVNFIPESIRVRGTGTDGTVLDKQIEAWYILAGGRRAYELALPDEQCRAIAQLSVAVQIGKTALEQRLETAAAPCAR